MRCNAANDGNGDAWQFVNCYLGFQTGKLCLNCVEHSLKLDADVSVAVQMLDPKLITYYCNACGNAGAGLTIDEETMAFTTRCSKSCPLLSRNCTCHCCDLPLDKAMKCSLCKTTYYCSKECQTKDWKSHHVTCNA